MSQQEKETKEFLEELKNTYEIAYEDDDILEIEKEVICDMCDGLGCKWCNNTGAIDCLLYTSPSPRDRG